MKTIRTILSAGVGAVLLFQTVAANAAFDAYIKVKGQKQGAFKGNSTREPTGNILVKLTHGPTSPAEYNRRTAAGEKLHEPIIVTLKLDAATRPQWTTAQSSNEVLSSVQISIFKASTTPSTPVTETITLTNATIEKLDLLSNPAADEVLPQTTDATHATVYLRVQFAYQKIEVSWKGGASASDDWNAAG
jgi:type VI secretion system Hcp family effector